jgi:hypothetical protein
MAPVLKTLPFLLACAVLVAQLTAVDGKTFSGRPDFDKIALANGTQTCEVERECPPRQYCYDGVCGCYAFYGEYGDECQHNKKDGVFVSIFCLSICLFQFYQNVLTMYQLKKSEAFQASSPSGLVMLSCMSASVAELLLMSLYLCMTLGMDPEYDINGECFDSLPSGLRTRLTNLFD